MSDAVDLSAGIVVIGAGIAGASCVTELRRRGFDGDLTLVGDEDELPYDRTLLSKSLFDPAVLTPERLLLHPREHYDELNVRLELGVAASKVDTRAREVRLADDSVLRYGAVVVCTGGHARLPRALRTPGVMTLRNLSDSAKLTEALRPGRRLIVIGGGFIGAEMAMTAASNGVDVVMLEGQDAPMAAAVGLEVGDRIAAVHRRDGVEVITGALVARVEERGPNFLVTLDDGHVLRGDTVLAAVGMAPSVDWLAGSGIPMDDGLLTGATCGVRAPAANMFAAGDCARWWHARYQSLIRVEHWDTAKRHGKAVARSVLGSPEPFTPVPFFWSYQGQEQYHWVGYAPSWDAVEIEEAECDGFVARYFVNGVASALLTANQPRLAAMARRDFEAAPPPMRSAS